MPEPTREQERTDDRLISLEAPCFYCLHRTALRNQSLTSGWTCTAYPQGIPRDILTRERAHTLVLPDQVGDAVYESGVWDFYDWPHFVTFDGKWESAV
jgi:hypothetical protein